MRVPVHRQRDRRRATGGPGQKVDRRDGAAINWATAVNETSEETSEMAKRGRPSEQLKRETSEGRVWTVISKLQDIGDFSKTIREVARLSGCSVGAVHKSLTWRGYLEEQQLRGVQGQAVPARPTRKRRSTQSVEGRVIQIVRDAMKNGNYSLTVRQISELIGCSRAAAGKTKAWSSYVDCREREKESRRNRLKERRIK